MNFKPLHDHILVRPLERVKSDTLVVVSDEEACQGEVMAVGPGREVKGRRRPLDVRVGDIVRFKFHETYGVVQENGARHLVIREADVEGIVEESPMEAA